MRIVVLTATWLACTGLVAADSEVAKAFVPSRALPRHASPAAVTSNLAKLEYENLQMQAELERLQAQIEKMDSSAQEQKPAENLKLGFEMLGIAIGGVFLYSIIDRMVKRQHAPVMNMSDSNGAELGSVAQRAGEPMMAVVPKSAMGDTLKSKDPTDPFSQKKVAKIMSGYGAQDWMPDGPHPEPTLKGMEYVKSLPAQGVPIPFPGMQDLVWDPFALATFDKPSPFDPLGYFTPITDARFRWYQEAELKHARVSMLACAGFYMGEKFHPFFGGNIDGPSIAIAGNPEFKTFWTNLLFICALFEFRGLKYFELPGQGGDMWSLRADHEPGNLGFDPFNIMPPSEKAEKDMRAKELQNGRLAMLAIAGMVAQEMVTGQKIFN